MTSTITLYYNSVLLPDKNMALDNAGSGKGIGLYLSTLTSKAIANFQYVKHGLSISIRLDESQTSLAMGSGAEDLNYCKIQNGTQNPIYYFIVGKKWKSQNTIELSLQMDTLNSFEYNVDYPLRAKTLVYREHHDRLSYLPGKVISIYSIYAAGGSWSYFYTDTMIQAGIASNFNASLSYGIEDENFVVSSIVETEDENGTPGLSISGTHTPGHYYTLVIKYDTVAARRIIHKPSEDIQAPKRKTKSETLFEGYGFSWNLLYRNKDIPDDHNQYENPVECFLIPDNVLTINAPSSDGIIDSLMIPDGQIMLIFADYGQFLFTFNDIQYMAYNASIRSASRYTGYAIKNDGGTLKLYTTTVQTNLVNIGSTWTFIDNASSPITVPNRDSIRVRMTNSLPDYNTILNSHLYAESAVTNTFSFSNVGTQMVNGIESVDRTDPRNIKLIKLPYVPSDVSVNGSGVVTLSPEWAFDSNSNLIKLINYSKPLVHKVVPNTDMSILTHEFVDMDGCTILTSRNKKYESKLYHSDFFTPKFVYDSFSKQFDLERIDSLKLTTANPTRGLFEFTFVVSRNVVSKFLFDMTQYVGDYVEETQDYNHIVCVARNNEEVLYNSQYLNYLRTGYNYDLKTKERTELTAGVGIGLNVAGLVASIGLSFVPGAQGIGIGAAVGSVIGLAGQLVNYAKTTAQNDQNIAQKLQEAQMQGVAVQNADDVDLLDYYSQNKAMLCYYKVSDEMEDALFDLFHYCGYKTNLQKVPDKSTRYWFNFVQADLVFVDTANLPSEVEEDIKAKFGDGVTFFHYREGYGFDFAQEKENWETAIVPYLDEPEE